MGNYTRDGNSPLQPISSQDDAYGKRGAERIFKPDTLQDHGCGARKFQVSNFIRHSMGFFN